MKLPLIALVLLLCAPVSQIRTQTPTPTPTPPTGGIQPIVNGKAFTDLDMNNFRLLNWDYSNYPLGGGGGGGAGLPSQPGHNGQFLQTDGTNPLWATVSFASLSGKPTTVSGYGITDALINDASPFSEILPGNLAAARANLGLAIGSNVEAWSANLDGWSSKAPYAGTFQLTLGKTFTVTNSITLSGSDAATLNIGGGGTLGSAAFSMNSAFDANGAAAAAQAASQPLDGDLTSLAGTTGTNTIYYRSAASTWSPVTIGTGLSFTGGTLSSSGGGGGGDVSSNITSSAANEIALFADASGKLITHATGFNGVATLSAGVLGATPQVGVTQGGTGLATINLGDIYYGSATNTVSRLSPNSAANNKYLRSFNLGAPSWQQIPFSDLISTPTTVSGYGITDALTTGNNLSDLSNKATARTNLGVAIGTNVEAWDADLDALAAISATAGSGTGINSAIPYRSAANTWGTVTIGTGLNFASGVLTATGAGTGDVFSDVSSSNNGQLPIFNGTTGKHITTTSLGNTILKVNALGVVTSSTPGIDYAQSGQTIITSAGTSGSPTTWPTAGLGTATVAVEGTSLNTGSVDGYTKLPAANTFSGGTIITYYDGTTTGNFGRNFTAFNNGSDTLNGALYGTYLRPFIAGNQGAYSAKSVQFTTDGASAWRIVNANNVALRIEDPTDNTKRAVFDASAISTATTRTIKIPNADSTTVVPLTKTPGAWLDGMGADGNFTSSPVPLSGLTLVQDDITSGGIVSNAHTVSPSDGTLDNVKLSATLSAPLTVTWPPAANYSPGETVRFFDISQSISPGNTVTITNATDTFNVPGQAGLSSVIINAPGSNRTATADPATNTWSFSSSGISIDYQVLTEDTTNHRFTWVPLAGAQKHIAVIKPTANDSLLVDATNLVPGMEFVVTVVQDATGGRTITPPVGSRTASDGQGILNIATGSGAMTQVHGIYYGISNANWLWETIGLNYTGAVVAACTSADVTNGTGAAGGINIALNSATQYYATRFSTGSGVTSLCRADVGLYYVGTPVSGEQITVELRSDSSGTPGSVLGTSNARPASDIVQTTSSGAVSAPLEFDFPTPVTGLTPTTGVYWITVHSTKSSSVNHPAWAYQTTGTQASYKSSDGVIWSAGQANSKLYFVSYH